MSTAIERFRPQEQALVRVAAELGILQKSNDGAMLINLGDPRLKEQFNVLAPATTLAKADANFTPAISVVALDPADSYPTSKGENAKKALSKVQLDQIAKVAGIEDESPAIVYFGVSNENVRVTWSARMRRPDGTWQRATGSREWIEADEKEQLLGSVPQYVLKDGPPNSTNAAFNKWWNDRWFGQVKRHRLGMTETKARLRAYRSLLTVKAGYTDAELRKPFLIASTSFTPDTSDLRILGMMMSQGREAAGLLYGPESGAQPVDPVIDIEGREEPPAGVDPETGEIEERETHGTRPTDDFKVPRGPHAGEMLSEVCRDDPGYVRAKLLGNQKLGPLAAEWLVFWHGQEGDDLSDVAF